MCSAHTLGAGSYPTQKLFGEAQRGDVVTHALRDSRAYLSKLRGKLGSEPGERAHGIVQHQHLAVAGAVPRADADGLPACSSSS